MVTIGMNLRFVGLYKVFLMSNVVEGSFHVALSGGLATVPSVLAEEYQIYYYLHLDYPHHAIQRHFFGYIPRQRSGST